MIFVPENRKYFATSGWIEDALRSSRAKHSSVAGYLETGTDSPRP